LIYLKQSEELNRKKLTKLPVAGDEIEESLISLTKLPGNCCLRLAAENYWMISIEMIELPAGASVVTATLTWGLVSQEKN